MGRPTIFDQSVFDAICAEIEEGVPLTEICRREGMPSRSAVYSWMREDESGKLKEHFTRARELGGDAIADDILDIIDDGTNDWMKRTGKDGEDYWELNGEHVQRSKLRAEMRLKLLAKWFPQRYGDKLDMTTGGEKMNASIAVTIVPPKDDDE